MCIHISTPYSSYTRLKTPRPGRPRSAAAPGARRSRPWPAWKSSALSSYVPFAKQDPQFMETTINKCIYIYTCVYHISYIIYISHIYMQHIYL